MSLPDSTAEPLKPLRTWSLLAGQKKAPSEYEIVSVKTIFRANANDKLEMSPNAPINQWYRRNVNDTRLRHEDFDAFRDPDQITYRAYCTERDRDEVYVEGLLSQYAAHGHDAKLPVQWVEQLSALYTPLRYLLHTAQMAAAYGVSVCTASTITNCLSFQMGDQFRWVSRVAYRTAELGKAWPALGFGTGERARWEGASEWQGFRELMEHLLTTYDWGSSHLAMNLVAMPAIDVALGLLRDAAGEHGDGLTQCLLDAHLANSARRNRWMKKFMEFSNARPENVAFTTEIVSRWKPLAEEAVYRFGNAIAKGRGSDAKAALEHAMKLY